MCLESPLEGSSTKRVFPFGCEGCLVIDVKVGIKMEIRTQLRGHPSRISLRSASCGKDERLTLVRSPLDGRY